MWKNKTTEVEVPAYVPPVSPVAPAKTDAGTGIRVVKPANARPPAAGEGLDKNEVPSWGTGTRAASPSPSAHFASPIAPVAPAAAGSVLGAALNVKGEISGTDDILINGSVDGLIQMESQKVTVGSTAKIVADVLAAEIIVYGNIKGNLCARDRIEIKKDGSVIGDLTTSRITIEDGAYFKGTIEIDRKAAAPSEATDRAPRKDPQPERTPERALNINGGTPSLHMP